ncbi:MAG: hypothetical protein LW832_00655 [Parachlamydia sp.]|jgi:hypothetical protein|nr:hypothetical protein [Parachlamydia sp.]
MISFIDQQNSPWKSIQLEYKGDTFLFPYHAPSEQIYNSDPQSLVRWKCLCLTGLTPLAIAGRLIYQLSKLAFTCVQESFNYLDGHDFNGKVIWSDAYENIRVIKYGCRLMLTAVKGVFNPFDNRAEYGRLERKLNGQKDKSQRNRFYLAVCFQPKDKIADFNQRDEQLRIATRLVKHAQFIRKIDKWKLALFSCKLKAFHKHSQEIIALKKNYSP